MQQPPSSTDQPQRQIPLLIALIVAISTPATLALSYFHLTGDPTFQPLALSVERLVERGHEVRHSVVQAVIQSDGSPEAVEQARKLGQAITMAFYGIGIDALVRHDPATRPGQITATFFVGRSRFGPYTTATAVRGVRASAETLRMNRTSQEASRPHRW